MRVVADSHAIAWYILPSPLLSPEGRNALAEAEDTDGIVVSSVTIVDLWYVTQTTKAVSVDDLARLRAEIAMSDGVELAPVDEAVAGAFTAIPRSTLGDPWDRFIVATALTLSVPLVTRDSAIRSSGLVRTIW